MRMQAIPLNLRNRIAELDGSREENEAALSVATAVGGSMRFVRIRSLPRLDGKLPSLLPFVRGLWTLQAPWSMLALGRPGEVALYVGSGAASVDWPAVLESSLAGGEISSATGGADLAREVMSLPVVASIGGNPFVERGDTLTPGPVELLAGSLANERWAYLVFARPIAASAVHQSLLTLRRELAEVASDFQRRGSAEEQNHPTARHLLDLLSAAQKQHELGAQVGMWKLSACLLTKHAQSLSVAAQAAMAALARGKSAPRAMRIRRLDVVAPCVFTPLTSEEACIYAALPAIELAGVGQIETARFSVNAPPATSHNRVACGLILNQRRRTPNWFEVDRDDLTRHTFICGATGSGKTRTCQSLLRQLWIEQQVPWLVIEPAMKAEYRLMLASELRNDLRIYTPGKADVAPLYINPLERVEGIGMDAHIDSLVGLFSAAFGLMTPMPFVVRLALQRLFEQIDHPTLADLQQVVRTTIAGLGYQGEIEANLRAAMELRLQTMLSGVPGQVLNSGSSTPTQAWLDRPTIIELSALGDDATRALVMGAILLRLVQERQRQGLSATLRHVAVIEEAHRLLGRRAPRVEGADGQEHAAEAFAHLLSEVRAFGQGLMVVDQSPAKLIPDVIRNTQLKIVHRLSSAEDQSAVAAAMGLDEPQRRSISALAVGEAVAFSARSHEPCRIAVPDLLSESGTARLDVPDDVAVATHMRSTLTKAVPALRDSPCHQCPASVNCATGRAVGRYLIRNDEATAFGEALSGSLPALRAFGLRVAREAGLSPEAARCVVLQIARAVGVAESAIDQLRHRFDTG